MPLYRANQGSNGSNTGGNIMKTSKSPACLCCWRTIVAASLILGAVPAGAASLATGQGTCHAGGSVSPLPPITFGPSAQSLSCDQGTVVNSGMYNYSDSTFAATSIEGLWALARGSVTGGQDDTFSTRYPLGDSSATITYSFNVTAPADYDPNLKVRLLVDLFLQTSLSGGDSENQSRADASVSLEDTSTYISNSVNKVACSHGGYPGDCRGVTEFSGQITDDVTPNALILVTIRSAITLLNGQGGSVPAQAYAFADPHIQIDPLFLDEHPGYGLVFGANVLNAPPVPVPAAGWLLLTGLAAIPRRARHRRPGGAGQSLSR